MQDWYLVYGLCPLSKLTALDATRSYLYPTMHSYFLSTYCSPTRKIDVSASLPSELDVADYLLPLVSKF